VSERTTSTRDTSPEGSHTHRSPQAGGPALLVRAEKPLSGHGNAGSVAIASERRVAGRARASRDASPVSTAEHPAEIRLYDHAVVCHEQPLTCPVNRPRCESIACVDGGSTAEDVGLDQEPAA
jgi:hypothetical protein